MPNEVTIQKLAEAINKSWRKTTESVLETARLCAEADRKLETNEKKKLVEDLDFNDSTFSKLVTIGSRPQLQTDPVKSLLPPNYSVVYQLATLTEAEVERAIKEGVVSPNMTRIQLNNWLAERRGRVTKADAAERAKIIATVQVPPDYDLKKQILLEKALDKLRTQFGFSLERPRDPEEVKFNRMARQVDEHIRKGAKAFIHALKARRLHDAGKLVAERKKLWPFTDDEITIASDATWEQMKAALEVVGNGDQFERLRDEALRLYGVPEERVSDHPIIDHDEAMEEIRAAMRQSHNGTQGKPISERFADFK